MAPTRLHRPHAAKAYKFSDDTIYASLLEVDQTSGESESEQDEIEKNTMRNMAKKKRARVYWCRRTLTPARLIRFYIHFLNYKLKHFHIYKYQRYEADRATKRSKCGTRRVESARKRFTDTTIGSHVCYMWRSGVRSCQAAVTGPSRFFSSFLVLYW